MIAGIERKVVVQVDVDDYEVIYWEWLLMGHL